MHRVSVWESLLPQDSNAADTSEDKGRSLGVGERRQHPRQRVSSIAYVELEDNNGGIVLNVSEGGLSLAAAGVLAADHPPRIRIQLPQSREWVELPAEIAWVSESKKEAGIRFHELTPEAGTRIKNWISSEASPARRQRESGRYTKEENPLPGSSNGGTPEPLLLERTLSERSTAEKPLMSRLSQDGAPLDIGTKNGTPEAALQALGATAGKAADSANLADTLERRIHARRQIKSLLYIELGKSNCGVVVNMSEDGLHLEAAATLIDEHIPQMRFQLPQSQEWIEASGLVVWVSESRLKAGVRFVDLPADNRASIVEWVSREPSQVQSRVPTDTAREQSPRIDRTANISTAKGPVAGHASRTKGQPLRISLVTSSSPSGIRSSSAVPVATVESVRPVDEARGRTRAKQITNWLNTIVPLQSWRSFVAPVVVVAVLSFIVGWFAARQRGGDRPVLTASVKTEPAIESTKRSAPPATSSDARPSSAARSGPPTSDPFDQGTLANRKATTPVNSGLGADPAARGSQKPSGDPTLKAGSRVPEGTKSAERVIKISPALPVVDAPKSSAAETPARTPGSPAKQSLQPVVTTPSPTPARPQPAATVPSKGKESATPPVKPPEIPVIPSGSVSVNFPAFPSIRVPSEMKSKSSRLGTSLQIGQLISRVEPIYPEEIRRQRIEGTVKLHAIIGGDGTIQSVGFVSGPPLLAPLAMGAVRQWHFKPTLLGGQPIEAEEDITVVFRLANTAIRSN
jgi:TonB family protein